MTRPLAVVVLFLGGCTTVAAQSLQTQSQGGRISIASTPSAEFAVHTDFVSLLSEDRTTIGGRFARRHQDWLMSEWSYDRTSKPDGRESRVLVGGVRLQHPYARFGKRAFITAGIAAADGLSFGWSPMVGAGSQFESDGGTAAVRFELQIFTRGRVGETYDRARLIVGVAIGIP
jgi:hypothetical protein